MKATLDIPDTLYRRVKAKSAMEGHSIRLVAIDLFSAWVDAAPRAEAKPGTNDASKPDVLPPWFGVARSYATKVKRHDMEAIRDSITEARREA